MHHVDRWKERCRAAFAGLSVFCSVDRELHAQFERAQRDFTADSGESLQGTRSLRYFEWFALERAMDGHHAPPIAAFVQLGCPGLAEDLRAWAMALQDARVEVAVIVDVDALGLDCRLASDGSDVRLHWREDPLRPGSGDTVLGFLVPVPGETGYLATDAVAQLEGRGVYELFADDAAEKRLAGRIEDELRPTMLELDRFLSLQKERPPRPRHVLEQELDALLEGLDPGLRAVDLGETVLRSGDPGAVFGPLLERLAFESSVDLDRVRPLLLEYQNCLLLAGEEPAAPEPRPRRRRPSGGEIDGASILARIEEAEARGERLYDVLDQLEDELGVPEDEREDEDELVPARIDWATEDEGSLALLLEEFLWDRQRNGRALEEEFAQSLRGFVLTIEKAGVREPESIDAARLAAYLIEQWQQGGIHACTESLAPIGLFETWLEDVHELAFASDAGELRVELSQDQARVRDLELRVGEGAGADDAPLAWHAVHKEEDGTWRFEHERRVLRCGGGLPFATGDLVLGIARADGTGFAAGARILPVVLARFLRAPDA